MIISVLEYLQSSADQYPNKVAFADEEHALTFGEINSYAKSIGTALLSGKKRRPYLILMSKSAHNIACFMGVLYSGNYYCPVDITMPLERLQIIVDTLNPIGIIAEPQTRELVGKIVGEFEIHFYEDLIEKTPDENELEKIQRRIIDTDPVYVLFTSGSTGIPKGVIVNHRGIIDFTDWMADKFEITAEDNFANQSPFFFDLSIGDLFCTLKTGATNYIVPHSLFVFPVKLIDYLNDKHITIIFWVPSALCVVANLRALNKNQPKYLTRVMFCGEVMPNKQLNVWRKALPKTLFANLYGPCEAVDASTYYIVDREFSDDEPLPIGVSCRNTDIILLDEEDNEVHGDGLGEICIRGSSLAMGYLNNPDRTSSAFTYNPLNSAYPEMIYRTGDLARYNEYGELMYAGRKDFQIKHMGHRIELGEIETAVDSISEIEVNACIYDEVKHRIVLYYTGHQIDDEYINDVLSQKVTDYMMPNDIIYIEKFPYNANGKIDRKELKRMYYDRY